ncbi:histidine-specific methyltransferase [Blyttiomyces helicus]|uniref:Histidine-specific methyltransferase n=1 Tax=Blyttiomyces helicus TaxID=388810 RepID=A0A4P9VXM2_9FUNG|nr:histidine-specific methyltransferase [Blyttiomyces helicus]|eukprot:RKO83050.1 histidine-specific methyltransferase [Blyttiomyces helicus]
MRKTKYLLSSIAAHGKHVTYYAVDLSETSLRASILPLATTFPTIDFIGLLGTYEDALHHIAQTIPPQIPKTYLWLGSSIGNLTRTEAADFLANVRETAMQDGDLFVCGIDRRNDPKLVARAYDDREGLTREFILNGIDAVNAIWARDPEGAREGPAFEREGFEYLSYYNAVEGRHEAYYRSLRDQTIVGPGGMEVVLAEGELINVEYSYKYSKEEVDELVERAGLYNVGKWTDSQEVRIRDGCGK